MDHLGDVAMILWAAALHHDSARLAFDRMIEFDPVSSAYPTVDSPGA
ncbi:MAG: hypothetical protein IH939_07035 [Acidobacteria bacterium]|nr:hypothetical protein [Acidobacteriota bacterium]